MKETTYSDLSVLPWHDALLRIEQAEGVVIVLVSDHAPSRLLCSRLQGYRSLYSRRGYELHVVVVDEDCAPHPELAAVRLPQIRVFTDGDETVRKVGTQDEDTLASLLDD